jgi:ABC-type branched-subunit amino acid transport system substrate-binding protein
MTERSRCRRGPFLVSLLAAVLVAASAGCGARWSEEQATSVRDRYVSGGVGTVGSPSGAAGPSTTLAAGSSGQGGGGASGGGAAAGGVASGGPAAAGGGIAGPAAATALPCAAPSDAPGVTDSQIVVGSLSSLSGPVPGLGESAAAAVRAYVAFRNSTGGVCGREIVLREADDGTDISRYRSALAQMAPNVLAITGGFAIGDVGGQVDELAIPIVNTPTGDTGLSPWVIDMNPDPADLHAAVGKYRYLYEQGARQVAMVYLGIDQSRREANIQRSLMEAAGLQVVDVNELPISTLSYDAAARRAAQSGANYLWATLDTNGQASLARAVVDSGYDWLIRELGYTTYGTQFLDLAGSAAEGVTAWLRSLPTEEAGANATMGAYVEWMGQVAPGTPQDLFSIDSWAGTQAFFEALEAMPGPITRDGVLAQLTATETFDAGGMYAPIALGREISQACFMGVVARSGRWERLAPPSGYLCA